MIVGSSLGFVLRGCETRLAVTVDLLLSVVVSGFTVRWDVDFKVVLRLLRVVSILIAGLVETFGDLVTDRSRVLFFTDAVVAAGLSFLSL